MDYLGTSAYTGITSGSFNFNLTGVVSEYDALLIVVNPTAGINPVCALVSNTTLGAAGTGAAPNFSTALMQKPGVTTTFEGIVPCINNPNDTLSITLYFNSTTSSSGNIYVYGLTKAITPPFRPDGRACPIGRFGATATTATTTPIVAAPTTPLRILIKSLFISSGANTQGSVTCTIGGATVTLGFSSVVEVSPSIIATDGILLDAATALTLNSAASVTAAGTAIYDLVV